MLHMKSEPVDPVRENLVLMFSTLENDLANSKVPGVGLAGVQVGILKRVAIVRVPGGASLNLYNPVILDQDGQVVAGEGCLSLPGLQKNVARAEEITLQNGDGRKYVLTGYEARVVQHEIDHLDGTVIADKEYRAVKIGRNEPCPCGKRNADGNIIKFKKCHLGKENLQPLTK